MDDRASGAGSADGRDRLKPEELPLHHLHDGEIRRRHEDQEDEEPARERDEPQRGRERHVRQRHRDRDDEQGGGRQREAGLIGPMTSMNFLMTAMSQRWGFMTKLASTLSVGM